MKRSSIKVLVVMVAVLSMGCTKSEYDKLVSKELAKNVRYDSLFLGVHFGMPRKDFFTHCWELNKTGVIRQGPGNLSVQYELDSITMKNKTYMWFYPEFNEDKISKMPVEFSYQNWAPWNQELSSDTLLLEVKRLFEKWYGGQFIEVKNEDVTQALWVKVDGNRRIRLFKKNISTVRADFVNLLEIKNSEDKLEK